MSDILENDLEEMALEIMKRSPGASAPQLHDIVSRVMMDRGQNPRNVVLRARIGQKFRELKKEVA